jgi:hypothetical protein
MGGPEIGSFGPMGILAFLIALGLIVACWQFIVGLIALGVIAFLAIMAGAVAIAVLVAIWQSGPALTITIATVLTIAAVAIGREIRQQRQISRSIRRGPPRQSWRAFWRHGFGIGRGVASNGR